jgi:hypothetical protein
VSLITLPAADAVSVWVTPGVPRPDLVARLRGMVEELDDEQIGSLLGLTSRTVRRVRYAAGLRRQTTPERAREIAAVDAVFRALHGEGLTSQQIGDHLQVSDQTVRTRLRRLGLEPHRSPNGRSPTGRTETIAFKVSPLERQELERRAEERKMSLSVYIRGELFEELQ